jgi:serine phosphatase RsbU (regulator of sigma subunit)
MKRIHYLLALAALLTIYGIQLNQSGYRLPVYYMPDGKVVSIWGLDPAPRFRQILEIGGQAPQTAPAILQQSGHVVVLTDKGPALMKVVEVNRLRQFREFAPLILLSALYMLTAIWFVQFGQDLYLASFCFMGTVFLVSFVGSLAGSGLHLIWQASGFLILPTLLNMGLRTAGKEISGSVLLAEFLFSLFFVLIAYVGASDLRTFSSLLQVQHVLLYLVIFAVLGLQVENAVRTTADRLERRKRWFLVSGTVAGFLLPLAAIDARPTAGTASILFAAVCAAVFPASLVYGTYRLFVVPFQFVLSRSILAGLLTVFFISLYSVVLVAHSVFLPDQEEQYRWIAHVVFLLTLVFFLDPARRQISAFIEKNIWRLDSLSAESLKRIARVFSESTRVGDTADQFLDEVGSVLGVQKVNLMVSDRSFPGFRLPGQSMIRMPDSSPIWKHIQPERIQVASYLALGGGSRGILYRFMVENEYFLAVGISGNERTFGGALKAIARSIPRIRQAVPAALIAPDPPRPQVAMLIGFKKDRPSFTLSEIRYIQEAGRLARMLSVNYEILLDEIAKRRKLREIVLAGHAQRNVAEAWQASEVKDLSIAAVSRPVLSVTGDYLDFIPMGPNKAAFFLGDVSGHGLGTGYLAAAIHAMARSHVLAGRPLAETVGMLNSFLIERYRGNEFITLFAFFMDLEKGRMEYLNAAHPGPMLFRAASGAIDTLRDTQRLPGLLPDPYHTSVLTIEKGDRLFLYSDGITETFNPQAQLYGEARLRQFLYANLGVPIAELPAKLERELQDFRGSPHPGDDSTFVAIEYTPRNRGLLSFLIPDA